jgi:phosphatidate cytidylyltransferase
MSRRRSSRLATPPESESDAPLRKRATTPRRSAATKGASKEGRFEEVVLATDTLSSPKLVKKASPAVAAKTVATPSAASSTTVTAASASTSSAAAPAAKEGEATWRKVFRRFWTSLAMFLVFCYVIHVGQPAMLALVMAVQFLMYREVVRLAYSTLLTASEQVHIPLFRTQNWYWFFVTIFYTYGRVARGVLGVDIPYHLFTSFCLLVTGFVGFVLTLRPGMYRRQFSMFAWVLLALAIVVLQSTMLVHNMFQGLFWFVLPAILIISNDSWAYVWGMLVGRTPLIALSPRKTWEGFIGAFFSTCLTGFFVSRVMSWFPILTCPVSALSLTHPTCALDPVFVTSTVSLNLPLVGLYSFGFAPVQIHGLVMAVFASAIAPFGGFFASGFKRAFKIKDFGDLIPGHGGLTDRMDCQLLMGVFVYVYYWSFVNPYEAGTAYATSVEGILELALRLNVSGQAQLFEALGKHIGSSTVATAAAAASAAVIGGRA